MRNDWIFILLFLISLQVFAAEEEFIVRDKGAVISIGETPQDLQIPAAIWEHLSDEFRPNLVFVPLRVLMSEKNSGVLEQKQITFLLPRGGGDIDLSQYVKEKQGSFFVDFDFGKEVPAENLRIFFISQNRKRKLDGVIHGSGCRNFYDVKGYVLRASSNGGLLVNTTRMRHLSVLGGTFLFAAKVGKEVHMTQVTFKDSKNKKYFCEKRSLKTPVEKEDLDELSESL